MTRVIHTGDTHLGYRQYHVPERREDFLAAFRQVAEDAVTDDVDAVVHAGDLFHDRRPGLADIMDALSVLRTLDDADVPFLAVVGNHEAKRDAQWLDLYESLGLATRLGRDPVVVGDTAFYGLDYVPESQRDALDYDFAPNDADHAALVTHGLFQPFDHGDWDAGTVIEEATVGFDALLLGDNHDAQRAELDGTWLTYCGSTERASADERADRGYNIVTFDGEVRITRRGIPTREFVCVDVELGPGEGVERVRERVGQHDLSDAVVVVTIDGEGEPVVPASVEEFAEERGALVARVTDHREVETEADLEVSFADPDDAVRERIRELGLSAAARDIDETIRASKVADSNVADEVQRRVQEAVEADDPAAFETGVAPAAADDPDDVPYGDAANTSTDSTSANASTDGDAAESDDAGDASDDDAADASDDDSADAATGGESADVSTDASTRGEGSTDDGSAERRQDSADEGSADGQASMEEYL